ncbi:hypothetical protein ACFE04_022286 [Oxalis oulophora]
MKCPYCSTAAEGRCATTTSGRSITECTSCGRVVEERQTQNHHFFNLRAQDNPLCLVTSDLPTLPAAAEGGDNGKDDDDPFESTGFITAFSTWSLEQSPLFFQSSLAFSGHLAELERTLELSAAAGSTSSSSSVVVDNLRAYMQIIDIASILGLEKDISDHAFQLFRDCCSATCLRNRSVEALATAALVQAIREAQEPRTLQEISIAANVPQKEIGKYIKILGEALQLSQPLNSNSISVHMPRFCTLLQLNKSAQNFIFFMEIVAFGVLCLGAFPSSYCIVSGLELATHIGEVVINKCFCTRRNPISISAAAIYLACQLEDKRKTQAEICKVTGLTEVTLRKVYKELLENWDDLLPSNYTPAVPPEKAFPTTTIPASRSSTPRIDEIEASWEKDKQNGMQKSVKQMHDDARLKQAHDDARMKQTHDDARMKQIHDDARMKQTHDDARMKLIHDDARMKQIHDDARMKKIHDDAHSNGNSRGSPTPILNQAPTSRPPWLQFVTGSGAREKNQGAAVLDMNDKRAHHQESDQRIDGINQSPFSITPNSNICTISWSFPPTPSSGGSSSSAPFVQPPPKLQRGHSELKAVGNQTGGRSFNQNCDKEMQK